MKRFFLNAVGRSTLLSGRDLEFLEALQSENIPAKVVCRGIDHAVRAMDEAPRSILNCQKWIEDEIKTFKQKRRQKDPTNDGSNDLSDSSENRIEATVRKIQKRFEREEFRAAYNRVIRELEECNCVDYESIVDIDHKLQQTFYNALSRREKKHLESKLADLLAGDTHLQKMSETARDQHRSAKRRQLLEREYGFVPLSEALA